MGECAFGRVFMSLYETTASVGKRPQSKETQISREWRKELITS